MFTKLREVILKRLNLKELWVLFFILGIVMMNYPFLHIFNKPIQLEGIPLLFLYYHIGWLVSILVIYLFTKANGTPDDKNNHGA